MRVLGLGNALIDILARIEDDSLLNRLNLPKGSMQLVDEQNAHNVSEALKDYKTTMASGGSAANTIHGLANLGVNVGFIGKVGHDELGDFFRSDMANADIVPHLHYSKSMRSGHCTSLISVDSERTMATYLGAAVELSIDDIDDSVFADYQILHVEGYLVQNAGLIEGALRKAKAKGLKVSLDLASYNVVEDNFEFLTRLVDEYVDILFANEEEAKAFTHKEGRDALNYMASKAEISVLKLGSKGSIINFKGEFEEVGIVPVKSIDTTGAGDLYAAGFLYGMINKYSPRLCGQFGALLAGNVIEVVGPKMDSGRWNHVRSVIKEMK